MLLTSLNVITFPKPVFDEVQQCPFVVADNMFIGYDNPRSWQSKIRWMKKAGYGGVIVWALDLDDFNGTFCDQGKAVSVRHESQFLQAAVSLKGECFSSVYKRNRLWHPI